MKQILIGNRIPYEYFITHGKGESDIAVHAGSFHLSLKDAGIETANIMTYSSIMPSIAKEIKKPEIVHGEVMECIMSVGNTVKNERISAGIVYGWLYDKTGKRYGGLVCEQQGDFSKETLTINLLNSLEELYVNGFSEEYKLKDIKTILEEITPKKKFGTALVSICFTNYLVPVIE